MVATPKFNGSYLKKARNARKITAIELAKKVGISKQIISEYENKRKSPSLDILEKIAETLDFPMSFFMMQETFQHDFDTPAFYRSMISTTKSARLMAEEKFNWLLNLVFLLETFIEFPTVHFPDIECPSDPEKISNNFIEEVATKVRRFWGLQDGPISNSIWLLENNGAIIIRRNLENSKLDAFSRWVDGRPFIILNDDKESASRSRFSLAHELGHLILHRNISESDLNKKNIFDLVEEQANLFAGVFHFPQSSFLGEVGKPSLERFRLLKSKWKLSIGMMIKRAGQLNLVNERELHNLWINYGRRGWRSVEPLDDKLDPEYPNVLIDAINIVINNKILSHHDLVQELNLYLNDIEYCAGLPVGVLGSHKIVQLKKRINNREHNNNLEIRGQIINFPTMA